MSKAVVLAESIENGSEISSSDEGFTLIETIIGAVLMSIVALGVIGPLVWSQQTIADQQTASFATNASVEALEHIRYGGQSNSVGCVDIRSRANAMNGEERTTRSGKPFTIQVTHNGLDMCRQSGAGTMDIVITASSGGQEVEGSRISTKVFFQ